EGAPLAQERTAAVEYLHAAVGQISNVYLVALDVDTAWAVELAVSRAEGAPLAQERTATVEGLPAEVAGIRNVHFVALDVETVWYIELAVSTPKGAPRAQKDLGVRHRSAGYGQGYCCSHPYMTSTKRGKPYTPVNELTEGTSPY